MKVWRIYIKEKEETVSTDKYVLYAVTNKEKYAKSFLNDRNKKRFFVKSSKMSKQEYITFANENRSTVLQESKFITRKIKNGFITTTTVPVIVTFNESQESSEEEAYISINTEEWWYKAPPHILFNKEMQSALSLLQYPMMYKIMSTNPVIDPKDDDYSAPEQYIDELMTFIRKFKDTF